jgi:hypothetical protein
MTGRIYMRGPLFIDPSCETNLIASILKAQRVLRCDRRTHQYHSDLMRFKCTVGVLASYFLGCYILLLNFNQTR